MKETVDIIVPRKVYHTNERCIRINKDASLVLDILRLKTGLSYCDIASQIIVQCQDRINIIEKGRDD